MSDSSHIPWATSLPVVVVVWLALAAFFWRIIYPRLTRGPGADPSIGLWWYIARLLSRFLHHWRVQADYRT